MPMVCPAALAGLATLHHAAVKRAAPMELIAVTLGKKGKKKKGSPSAQLHKRSASRALETRRSERLPLLCCPCHTKTCCHCFFLTFFFFPFSLNKGERQQAGFIMANKLESSLLGSHT